MWTDEDRRPWLSAFLRGSGAPVRPGDVITAEGRRRHVYRAALE